jgi:hypothetical protein
MKNLWSEFMVAARETPSMYFAIFVGAYKGVKAELQRIEMHKKHAYAAKAQLA